MTPLTKPVSRRTARIVDGGRRMVVTIAPGDVIGFRLERSRKTYWTTLSACYSVAVKQHVQRLREEKAKARKAKRKVK